MSWLLCSETGCLLYRQEHTKGQSKGFEEAHLKSKFGLAREGKERKVLSWKSQSLNVR